jgi:hypothetical protein
MKGSTGSGNSKFCRSLASNEMKSKESRQKMKTADAVAEKVAETLACLERLERLEAGADFVASVQARINAGAGKPAWAGGRGWPRFFSPVLRPAFLALLIVTNIVTVIFLARTQPAGEKAEKATVGAVVRDYAMDQNLHELYFAAEDVKP